MKSLEIIIASVTAFGLGATWYGLLFKNHWKNSTSETTSQKLVRSLLLFIAICTSTYFMNNGCLEMHINEGNTGHGIFHGGLYGLSYAVPIIAIHHVYERKRILTFLIDATYAMIVFGTIGGMLAFLTLMEY